MVINNLNVYDASVERLQCAREKGKTKISENVNSFLIASLGLPFCY